MQDDFEFQYNLLALNATLEAARGGDSSDFFARQAASFGNLSQEICGPKTSAAPANRGECLHEIESRLDILTREQEDISALATEITENSRATTGALQFDDVVEQVVVYSSDHAENLRTVAAQIEERQRAIATGIAADQNEIRSMAESCRQQLEAMPAEPDMSAESNPAGPCRQ